jgi:proline iminopeptidase
MPGRYLEELAGLGEGRTLVVVDPRGTGGSDAPVDEHAYALSDYVADVEELRMQVGLDRMDLLGHSHGALVALSYAARHAARVDRLVLVAVGARFDEERVAEMERAMEARAGEPWYPDAVAALADEQAGRFADDAELGALVGRELPFYFARLGEREEAAVRRFSALPVHAAALREFNANEFLTFDLRPVLERVTATTLVVAGERDFILGPTSGQEIADGITDARLVVLDEVGHMPWVEAPERFRAIVSAFLASSSPPVA